MNHSETLKPLYDVLACAQELVSLAQSEKWEEMDLVASRYQQQAACLEDTAYLQSLSELNMVEEAKALITQIAVLNNDLDTQTTLYREKVASELRQMSQSNKALEAYGR